MVLNPKLSGEFIVKNAKYLTVNDEGIQRVVDALISGIEDKTVDIKNFSQHDLHPKRMLLLLLIISINSE